jgi:hypothetical protein
MSSIIVATDSLPEKLSRPENLDISNALLFIGYNDKRTRFLCGTDSGFFICKTHPYKEEAIKSFSDGGIGIVEIVDEAERIVALVGGGSRPAFPRNKVIFYNYETKTMKGEMLCRQNILNVKPRNKYLAVVAEDFIFYMIARMISFEHTKHIPTHKD